MTAGSGRVQRRGGPVEEFRAGDVIWTPPGVDHWHGATAGAAMTHIAIYEHVNGNVVTWLEHVTDAEYGAAPRAAPGAAQAFLLDHVSAVAQARGVGEQDRMAPKVDRDLDDVAGGAGERRGDRRLAPGDAV